MRDGRAEDLATTRQLIGSYGIPEPEDTEMARAKGDNYFITPQYSEITT
jgi:hypothetical protein